MYSVQKDGLIRIAVIGEENVGKSSLISTYISTAFPERVPPVLTEAILPPENSESHISISVRDTQISKSNNFQSEIQKIVQSASCIIILYDSSRDESYNNLLQVWLPTIQATLSSDSNCKKPIIAVGSKIDLLVNDNNTTNNYKMKDKKGNEILKKFKFVTNCCSCSAKTKQHVKKVFQIAEQAVLYPIAPIFDYQIHNFTNLCKKALLRIFRIFDIDGDGLLSDYELSNFQEICFEESLTEKDITDLKKLIFDHCAEETIRDDCITYLGFEVIMKMFVDKYDTTGAIWEILRKFNYDDALNLQLPPEEIKDPTVSCPPPGHTTELSEEARDFLVHLAVQCSPHSPRSPRLTATKASTTATATAARRRESGGSHPLAITSQSLTDIFEPLPAAALHPWQRPPRFQCRNPEYLYLFPGFSDTASVPLRGRRSQTQTQTDQASVPSTSTSTQVLRYPSASTSTLQSWNGSFSIEVWILQWSLLATHSATLTKSSYVVQSPSHSSILIDDQELLFCLGYASRADTGIVTRPTAQISTRSRTRYLTRASATASDNVGNEIVANFVNIKVGVVGSRGSGKSTLISSLGNTYLDDSSLQLLSEDSEHRQVVSGYTCCLHSFRKLVVCSEVAIPVLLPGVPPVESFQSLEPYDVLVLLIDCTDADSMHQMLLLEKSLPPRVPRLFVISKADTLPTVNLPSSAGPTTAIDNNDSHGHHSSADSNFSESFSELTRYQISHNLPNVALLSSLTGEGIDELKSIVSDISLYPEKGMHKDNRSRSNLWYLVTFSAVVIAAVGLAASIQLWPFSSKKK